MFRASLNADRPSDEFSGTATGDLLGAPGGKRKTPVAKTVHSSEPYPQNQLPPQSACPSLITHSPKLLPEKMGISPQIFQKFGQVAKEKNCIIMIRKTNEGSVIYFDKATGVGKKLPTKGKSSNRPLTKGSITFFASMAKRVSDWYKEQTALIEVSTYKKEDKKTPKYTYIPKLIAIDSELIINKSTNTYSANIPDEDRIVSVNDKTGEGRDAFTSYYLKRVNFSDIKMVGGFEIAKPAFFKDEEDGLFCYQVFIDPDKIENSPKKINIKQEDLVDGSDSHAALERINNQSGILAWNIFWDNEGNANGAWRHRKIEGPRPGLGNAYGPNSPLTDFGPVETEHTGYRAVKVLALLAHVQPNHEGGHPDENPPQEQKYFEVVADYDTFMIAPNVRKCFGPTQPEIQLHPDDLVALEKKWWDEPFKDKFIPLSEGPTLVKAGKGSAIKSRHGIVSGFEMEVRAEMNEALGIKAVQHGCEVANIFYTSDIFEPIILVLPGANDPSTQLFFLDLEGLFRLTFNNQSNYSWIDTDNIFGLGTNKKIDVTIPRNFTVADDYAFVFNLNWGTPYYLEMVKPEHITNKDEWNKSQTAKFTKIIENLHKIVFPTTPPKDPEFVRIFPEHHAENHPFSIKVVELYLWQIWLKFIENEMVRGAELQPQPADRRIRHYIFIKRLIYLSKYYMSIFTEAPKFAPLVHKEDKVLEVRPNYKLAVQAILDLVTKKYMIKFWDIQAVEPDSQPPAQDPKPRRQRLGIFSNGLAPETPQEVAPRPFVQVNPDPQNLGKKDDPFYTKIKEWIQEMGVFLKPADPKQ